MWLRHPNSYTANAPLSKTGNPKSPVLMCCAIPGLSYELGLSFMCKLRAALHLEAGLNYTL